MASVVVTCVGSVGVSFTKGFYNNPFVPEFGIEDMVLISILNCHFKGAVVVVSAVE